MFWKFFQDFGVTSLQGNFLEAISIFISDPDPKAKLKQFTLYWLKCFPLDSSEELVKRKSSNVLSKLLATVLFYRQFILWPQFELSSYPDTRGLIGHVIVILASNCTSCSHSCKYLILFLILLASICLSNILQYWIIAHCVERDFLWSSLNLDCANFIYCPLQVGNGTR